MRSILNFIKYCWRALNFIRDCVMNIVFLLFVMLALTLFSLVATYHSKTDATIAVQGNQGALLLNLDGYLADNREVETFRTAIQRLENQHVPIQISTFDVVYAIEQAMDDERIKGIVLDLNYFEGADLPAIEYVGVALSRFKQSGKSVIAMSDNYGQSQYLLASYADKIYLNKTGEVAIHGLAYQNLYYKSMLEKLEITPHIFRVGTYKSAVEPFLRDDMSPQAKQNAKQWLEPMWEDYRQIIAMNRDIKAETVLPEPKQYLAELKQLKGDSTAHSKQRNLVTDLATRAETDKQLIELFGENAERKFRSIDLFSYLDTLPDRMSTEKSNKIAVVNVEGTIIDGESDENNAGGDTIARLLRQAHDDPKVKAVILRVNSPGGSAFASELIRQEVDNLQAAKKPVVVSMGNMAASGGYWISSTADWIVADRNTITGSIGIFAMFPTIEKTLKKAGITADGIATSSLSESGFTSGLSQDVKDMIQLNIEHGYDRFLDIVSKGRRNLTKEQVDNVAQGQIWLGEKAMELELVDENGTFYAAEARAAMLAELDDYGLEWMQEKDNSLLGQLFSGFNRGVKSAVQNTIIDVLGLPEQAKQVKQSMGILTKFNDPKGQYLYCLNCGKIN